MPNRFMQKSQKIRSLPCLFKLPRSWFMWTDTLLYRARNFKNFRHTVDCKESIPYNLSPLSVRSHGAINTPAVSSKFNFFFSDFLEGIALFTVWARVNFCYRFLTWIILNTRNRLYSLNPSRNVYVYYYIHFHKCTAILLNY